MRPVLAIIALLACAACSAGEKDEPLEDEVSAAQPAPTAPEPVIECASLFDGLKGPGHTVENAQLAETRCRGAREGAPDRCQDFLRAASRAGYKAAENIGVWSNVGTAQYIDAAEEANAARSACGV